MGEVPLYAHPLEPLYSKDGFLELCRDFGALTGRGPLAGYRGTSLIRKRTPLRTIPKSALWGTSLIRNRRPPQDPTVGLRLGPFGRPGGGWQFSYERGTHSEGRT